MSKSEIVMAIDPNDQQFRDDAIESITLNLDGPGFEYRLASGWCGFVDNGNGLPVPAAGNAVRLYGTGCFVRGFVCDGCVYWYETIAAFDARMKREADETKAERVRKFDENRADFERRVEALPDPLRDRVRFFMRNPEWGADSGGYELFCCEEAAKIIRAVRERGASDALVTGDIEPAKAAFPELAWDEHSGNTIYTAARLAAVVLHHADVSVSRLHAAACPIVGCDTAGCWASTPEAEQELIADAARTVAAAGSVVN